MVSTCYLLVFISFKLRKVKRCAAVIFVLRKIQVFFSQLCDEIVSLFEVIWMTQPKRIQYVVFSGPHIPGEDI